MSRHQNIRNLDLNEELADYEYEYDEYSDGGERACNRIRMPGRSADMANIIWSLAEMSEEDKVKMAAALAQVKATIGEVSGCSNKAIEDILWDYYYDVPKSINYILGKPRLFSNVIWTRKGS